MKIPLSDGSVALVDEVDAWRAEGWKWSLAKGYARRGQQTDYKQTTILLHREIMGLAPGDGLSVDHINGDKLDNRRGNLRVVSHAENLQNRTSANKNSTSGYRGVIWDKARQKWKAQVRLHGKCHLLGRYDDILEAAKVASDFRAKHMPFSKDANGI